MHLAAALDETEIQALAACDDVPALMSVAGALARAGHGDRITYSRKVFIPLTQLCRDVCHYCTFAKSPRRIEKAYLSLDEVVAIAKAGQAAGCKEALFTLGDQPEQRYAAARDALQKMGFASTLDYLHAAAQRVLDETGLLPHVNPGVMSQADLERLRAVSVSQGIMLETVSDRLSEKGGVHHGSPDKLPARRLETLEAAGRAAVPFTTGILIGIGETREERIRSLLAIRDLHARHGHIQEVIVQNFKPKPDTRMADWPEPPLADHLWTIAMARILLGPAMNIQAPPNLQPKALQQLLDAGINDWGGVSPVTPDHVNPEAPWPHLTALEAATEEAGRRLVERTALYPAYFAEPRRWLDAKILNAALKHVDAEYCAREENWSPGTSGALPPVASVVRNVTTPVRVVLEKSAAGTLLDEADIVTLFGARGSDVAAIRRAADDLRIRRNGDLVTYVVNRNINYTNVCTYACKFCAFSKGRHSAELRGPAYDLDLEEVARRTEEAWARGGTEVCMQGGIHPRYTGRTYLSLLEAVKRRVPDMHVHAFSPLEVTQGATTLSLSLRDYLTELKAAGLGSLPGTAAEILDDEVRREICPDKLTTDEWLEVVGTAHSVGLRTTATIMFGHVDSYMHWARHIIRIRDLQRQTGGFTEFVPLPFVHMEAPMYLRGRARGGPSYRETILMHAVARLALDPFITNIQTSWVKLGPAGVAAALQSGVNDLGGTLMNESISRAAGTEHGQEFPPEAMEALAASLGRTTRQRSTLYGTPPADRIAASFAAPTLTDIVLTPVRRRSEAAAQG